MGIYSKFIIMKDQVKRGRHYKGGCRGSWFFFLLVSMQAIRTELQYSRPCAKVERVILSHPSSPPSQAMQTSHCPSIPLHMEDQFPGNNIPFTTGAGVQQINNHLNSKVLHLHGQVN